MSTEVIGFLAGVCLLLAAEVVTAGVLAYRDRNCDKKAKAVKGTVKSQEELRAELAANGITIPADVEIPTYINEKRVGRDERSSFVVEEDEYGYQIKPLRGSKRLLEEQGSGVKDLYDSRKGIRKECLKESHCQVRAYKVMRKQARAAKRTGKWGADTASCFR